MFVQTYELTPSLIGLGDLEEVGFLTLAGTAQFKAFIEGTSGLRPSDIRSADGRPLYPAVYALKVRVPRARPLFGFKLWEDVSVGLEVEAYGGVLLETKAVLGASQAELGAEAELPTARWSSMWTAAGPGGAREVSHPKAGLLALRSRAGSPEAMEAFRAARAAGTVPGAAPLPLKQRAPWVYPVRSPRDVSPGGQLMFSRFLSVMDAAEAGFLGELWPPLPADLLAHRAVVERDVYYFGNCGEGTTLTGTVSAAFLPAPAATEGERRAFSALRRTPAGLLRFEHVLFDQQTARLMCVARVEKQLLVPSADQELVQEARRVVSSHLSSEPGADRG